MECCCYRILKVCFYHIFWWILFCSVNAYIVFKTEQGAEASLVHNMSMVWFGWFASILLLICSFIAYTSMCIELYTFLLTHSSCYFRLEETISVSTGLVHHGRNWKEMKLQLLFIVTRGLFLWVICLLMLRYICFFYYTPNASLFSLLCCVEY